MALSIPGAVDHTSPWRWIDRFSTSLAAIGGLATLVLMLNVVADVIGRHFFHRPLPGTLDLVQFGWMPTLVSLGLGYALLRGEHIRVNLLTSSASERAQRIVEILSMTLTLGAVALFIWFGVEKAIAATRIAEHATVTAWLLVWPFRWVTLIGLTGLLLQSFASLWRAITVAEFVADDEVMAAISSEESVLHDLEHTSASTDDLEKR